MRLFFDNLAIVIRGELLQMLLQPEGECLLGPVGGWRSRLSGNPPLLSPINAPLQKETHHIPTNTAAHGVNVADLCALPSGGVAG